MIEREVKLRFDSPDQARAAILATGATLLRDRRLQEDALFDTDDEVLQGQHSALRLRTETGTSLLTFKGPVAADTMKVRDEYETEVGSHVVMTQVLAALGLHVWFRYEKYREEYTAKDVIVALDETPVGTYIEIEGDEHGILAMTRALGRTPEDFILQSYRRLFVLRREEYGLGPDMLFRTR
ncbi:MAG: class IV adenylate cyclase [Acidobacteria bacterium]|nr:class IV adenylate cyclase [Acidobacteriota bacterium]